MKNLIILIAISFLFGCSDNKPVEVTLQSENPFCFNLHFKDSPEEVNKTYYELRAQASNDSIKDEEISRTDKRLGFHYLYNNNSNIVIIRPKAIDLDDFNKVLGHEVSHVMFGKYHPVNGKLPDRVFISKIDL